jgi:hypothetical protein
VQRWGIARRLALVDFTENNNAGKPSIWIVRNGGMEQKYAFTDSIDHSMDLESVHTHRAISSNFGWHIFVGFLN